MLAIPLPPFRQSITRAVAEGHVNDTELVRFGRLTDESATCVRLRLLSLCFLGFSRESLVIGVTGLVDLEVLVLEECLEPRVLENSSSNSALFLVLLVLAKLEPPSPLVLLLPLLFLFRSPSTAGLL